MNKHEQSKNWDVWIKWENPNSSNLKVGKKNTHFNTISILLKFGWPN